MTLSTPQARSAALSRLSPAPSKSLGVLLPPSDHLLCFDLLYYVRLVAGKEEWDEEWCPAWRLVGREMRWAPGVVQKAEALLRKHWGVREGEEIPPYISVHMRRADFKVYCADTLNCMPTLAQLQRRVLSVRSRLASLHGLHVPRVLVTSDESSPSWWSQIHQLGYTSINHTAEGTEEKWGEWYPSVLDSVFLSYGKGFVGTEGSTMSLLALRRVQDWGEGVGEWLMWKGVAESEL